MVSLPTCEMAIYGLEGYEIISTPNKNYVVKTLSPNVEGPPRILEFITDSQLKNVLKEIEKQQPKPNEGVQLSFGTTGRHTDVVKACRHRVILKIDGKDIKI